MYLVGGRSTSNLFIFRHKSTKKQFNKNKKYKKLKYSEVFIRQWRVNAWTWKCKDYCVKDIANTLQT